MTKKRPLKVLGHMPWNLIPNEVIVINSYNFRTSQISSAKLALETGSSLWDRLKHGCLFQKY